MTCPSEAFFRRATLAWCLFVVLLIAAAVATFDRSAVKTDFRSLLPAEAETVQTNDLFTAVADNNAGIYSSPSVPTQPKTRSRPRNLLKSP